MSASTTPKTNIASVSSCEAAKVGFLNQHGLLAANTYAKRTYRSGPTGMEPRVSKPTRSLMGNL